MRHEQAASPVFLGFPDLRANVTFVPLQFFTLVLPNRSRTCLRIVGYALRQPDFRYWRAIRGRPCGIA